MAEAVVTIQDEELKALCSRLNGMALKPADRKQLLHDIGVEMEAQTQERFHTKTDPDGNDWKALAESTVNFYKKKFGSKNPFNGLLWRNSPVPLRDTVISEAGSLEVLVGATAVYSAVHQFGYKGIPARPYLGLGADDRAEVIGIISRFLERRSA